MKILDKFHKWFDSISDPKRFLIFMLMLHPSYLIGCASLMSKFWGLIWVSYCMIGIIMLMALAYHKEFIYYRRYDDA